MNHMEQGNNKRELTRDELLRLVEKYERMLYDKAKELAEAREDARLANVITRLILKSATDDISTAVIDCAECAVCEYYTKDATEFPCNDCARGADSKNDNFVWRGKKILVEVQSNERDKQH